MESELITTGEAGQRLGILGKSVRRAITEGRLPARRIGMFYALDPADVERYRSAYPLRPGRPFGSADVRPRTRRTRAQIEMEMAG